MINEEDRHLADVLKIGGFALMSPLGKIVLSLPELRWSNLTIQVFVILHAILFWYNFLIKEYRESGRKKR